jgi:phytoene dehydrogenase-like protein
MGYDAIVIGAGHNGLTVAGLLAKSGRKVLALERRDRCGGVAAEAEFHPGYRVPGLLHDTASVRRQVVEALQLEKHGLRYRTSELPVYLAQENSPGLLLFRNAEKTAGELHALQAEDAPRYAEFRAFLERIRPFFHRLTDQEAPEIQSLGLGHLFELAGSALALRRLPQKDLLDVLRIGPMCIADWLNEWFKSPLLKAGLAQPALLGNWLGPRSAGSVVTFLLEEASAGPEVAGGPCALVRALEGSCRELGVEIRLGVETAAIRSDSKGIQGVTLSEGTQIDSRVVVATCDPRRTFLRLLSAREVPPALAQAMRNWRCRGTTAKLHLALSAPPEFSGRPGVTIEAARIGESLDHLERAFDAVKYGEASRVPMLDVRIPTFSDPGLAPKGHHVASILAHFAPYHLRGGWTPEQRKSFGDAVLAALGRHVPQLRERVVAGELLAPPDLEERYSLTEGHIHHGEMSLDQLFSLRPTPSCARHATPVPGLFLASPGTHPGGGVSCAPGLLAAAAVLRARS